MLTDTHMNCLHVAESNGAIKILSSSHRLAAQERNQSVIWLFEVLRFSGGSVVFVQGELSCRRPFPPALRKSGSFRTPKSAMLKDRYLKREIPMAIQFHYAALHYALASFADLAFRHTASGERGEISVGVSANL